MSRIEGLFTPGVFLMGQVTGLNVIQSILLAALVSFMGGAACAYRTGLGHYVALCYGVNLAVLGASITSMLYPLVLDKPGWEWLIIGACWLLSLQGISAIDMAFKWFKRRIDKNEPKG